TLCRSTSIGLTSLCWEHHVALFSSSFRSIFRHFALLFSCTPVLEASSEHPSQTARSPRSFLPGASQHDMSIRTCGTRKLTVLAAIMLVWDTEPMGVARPKARTDASHLSSSHPLTCRMRHTHTCVASGQPEPPLLHP
ncbi:unnamed protein product, partial [Ectocarpus sp. 4 AP-2014]